MSISKLIYSNNLSALKAMGISKITINGLEDDFNQITKIQASDAEDYDFFGRGISISNSHIVIGAPDEDSLDANAGAAYIYDKKGYNQIKITASDGQAQDNFGWSISISENKIVIGAPSESSVASNSGAVYIYDLDGTNELKIKASDASEGSSFGLSVKICGSKIVVGAPNDSAIVDNGGAAYIYNLDGTNEMKITPSDISQGDSFGLSVGIAGKIIIGSPYKTVGGVSNVGGAYSYNLDGSNESIIPSPPLPENSYFGRAVDVSNNRVVIGAPQDSTIDSDMGSAHLYDLNLNLIKTINSSDASSSDFFGYSLGLSDNRLVIGAPEEDEGGDNSGAAYIFNIDGDELTKIKANTPNNSEFFGKTLAVSDYNVLIGAPYSSVVNTNAGLGYLYKNFSNNLFDIKLDEKIGELYD